VPAVPAMTIQDLELEHAELLPVREILWVPQPYPRLYPSGPGHLVGTPARPWC
jgi:hypothetical protein